MASQNRAFTFTMMQAPIFLPFPSHSQLSTTLRWITCSLEKNFFQAIHSLLIANIVIDLACCVQMNLIWNMKHIEKWANSCHLDGLMHAMTCIQGSISSLYSQNRPRCYLGGILEDRRTVNIGREFSLSYIPHLHCYQI